MTSLVHRTPYRLTGLPAYRALRIALAVAAVLPGYLVLLARERLGRPAGPARWARAHERAAARIEALALHLRGLFVKVAQVIGARADVFPEPFVRRLSRFHDEVPPRPWTELRGFAEAELGAPLEALFAEVEETPLAAASLAQVHRARLPDGTRVVIKVQYPEIARIAAGDLAAVRRVAGLVARLERRIDLRSLAEEVARFVALELDFAREADFTERIARELAASPDARVPRVVRALSRPRLLVLEYLEGIPVARVDALRRAGHDPAAVGRRVARIWAEMIFEREAFHGDPHPGNLLVLPDGRIGLLDFGLCKELPPGFGANAAALLVAGAAGDGPGALRAAHALGFAVDGVPPEVVPALIRALLGQTPPDAALRELLGQGLLARIPSHFALIGRSLILLNGLSHTLAPGAQVIQEELLRALAPHAARLRERAQTSTSTSAPACSPER